MRKGIAVLQLNRTFGRLLSFTEDFFALPGIACLARTNRISPHHRDHGVGIGETRIKLNGLIE